MGAPLQQCQQLGTIIVGNDESVVVVVVIHDGYFGGAALSGHNDVPNLLVRVLREGFQSGGVDMLDKVAGQPEHMGVQSVVQINAKHLILAVSTLDVHEFRWQRDKRPR